MTKSKKPNRPAKTKEQQQQEMLDRAAKKVMDALRDLDLDTLEKVRQYDPKNRRTKK